MKEENIKVEELNTMELLKLIYEGVKNNSEEIQNVKKELKKLEERIGKIEEKVDKLEERIEKIEEKIEKIEEKIEKIEEKIEKIEEKIEKIEEKIKYLDIKIDNTKNTLVLEIAEEFKNFSAITEGRINNLEKKINNEIEDRMVDVSKVKEFNRMILNDIRSRVSILEEETEKYNLN